MDHAEQRRAVVAHYDHRAPTYDDSALHRGLVEQVADLVDELVGRTLDGPADGAAPHVLDVATGTGLALRSLAGRRPDWRLLGVDLSPGMLARARTALPRAGLLRADTGALPLPDGSVDVLTCVTALHLLADPDAALAEWARVLRPGGLVVTATFGPPAAPAPPSPAPPRGPQGFVRRHEPYRTAAGVTAALAPHGLEVVLHRTWRHGDDVLLLCAALRSGPRSAPPPPSP
ncbi:class I SAM-dependent methyltransferase [Nocardioides sp. GY 10127]|uniref:class I SAM-dependent methyltransferase n=1 Tax=Nocardioides sp. GY 10127 TaxID=2569762 RepID=UPI0010A82C20|nr:class I SAM-dependent methyltransferase [Nocardioides sp. GY 10127]TIC85528.1 methyltransferase domain-containing protein [Nocardioides sp. GY 10127]